MTKLKSIIMAILGGLAVLFVALFRSLKRENKKLKTQVEANKAVKTTQEKIIQDANKKPPARSRTKRTKGVIKGLAFACAVWSATACAATPPKPICPTLITVERPDFLIEIPYEYDVVAEVFTLTPENFDELVDQFNWCKYAISIYEAQLKTYSEWCNGANK